MYVLSLEHFFGVPVVDAIPAVNSILVVVAFPTVVSDPALADTDITAVKCKTEVLFSQSLKPSHRVL
jgi:hypothetical protein